MSDESCPSFYLFSFSPHTAIIRQSNFPSFEASLIITAAVLGFFRCVVKNIENENSSHISFDLSWFWGFSFIFPIDRRAHLWVFHRKNLVIVFRVQRLIFVGKSHQKRKKVEFTLDGFCRKTTTHTRERCQADERQRRTRYYIIFSTEMLELSHKNSFSSEIVSITFFVCVSMEQQEARRLKRMLSSHHFQRLLSYRSGVIFSAVKQHWLSWRRTRLSFLYVCHVSMTIWTSNK